MTSPADMNSFQLFYDLPHPPAKVWRALTEPELLGRWLMTTDMQARAGHAFTFRTEPTQWWDGIVNCEVLELEPQRRLAYTWKSGAGANALDTVVTWTLTPTASGGTRLVLEHSGFTAQNKQAFGGAKYGWVAMAGEKLPRVLAELA